MPSADEKSNYCGAKLRDGRLCRQRKVKGRTRCKFHGGATAPAGPDHHLYKHGRNSKFLPGRLQDKFLEAYNDPELLSLRKYAAIYDVRVRQLAGRLYTGESGGMWAKLGDQWAQLEAAQAEIRKAQKQSTDFREIAAQAIDEKDRNEALRNAKAADERRIQATEQFGVALQKIGELIASGKKDETNWRELLGTADEASAMKFRETKRLESERMMVPVTEVMTLVSVIYGYCRESADDMLPPDIGKRFLTRIGENLNRLINHAGAAARQLPKVAAPGQDAGVIDVEASSGGNDPEPYDENPGGADE